MGSAQGWWHPLASWLAGRAGSGQQRAAAAKHLGALIEEARRSDAEERARPSKRAPAKFPTRRRNCQCIKQSAIRSSIDTTGFHHSDRPSRTCEEQVVCRRMAMTATSTRSTRRAETLVALPPLAHAHRSPATAAATRLHQQNSSRPLKRLHDATNLRYDLKSPKKPKITVEIPSKSQYQARLFPENVDARQHHRPSSTHKPPKQDHRHPASAPLPPPPATAHTAAPPPAPAPATGDAATTTGQDSSAAPTKHREKVVNGIKHELDRLQPSSADMAASNGQGRKLRSQEGVRFKSELSAYFPEYDEVIGNVPKEERMLNHPAP